MWEKEKEKKEFASLIIRRLGEGGCWERCTEAENFPEINFHTISKQKQKTEIKNGALIFWEKTVKDKKSFLEETIKFGQNLISHNNAMKLNYSLQTLLWNTDKQLANFVGLLFYVSE